MNKKEIIFIIIMVLAASVFVVFVIPKNTNDQKIVEQSSQLVESEKAPSSTVVSEEANQENIAQPMQPIQSNQTTTPVVEVPKISLEINFSADGLSPKEINVKPGAQVTLTVSSKDTIIHTFAFEDPSLANAIISVGPSDIRTITFNAPTKAGEYAFFCKVSGHSSETGKMIVK